MCLADDFSVTSFLSAIGKWCLLTDEVPFAINIVLGQCNSIKLLLFALLCKE